MSNRHEYKIIPYGNNILDETFTPCERTFKYKHVWERTRIKLRFRLVLNKLLYAAVHKAEDPVLKKETDLKASINYVDLPTMNPDDIPWHVINPENKCLGVWNTFIGFTMLYSAIIMPFFMSFYGSGTLTPIDITDYLFTVLYFIDFCVQCNTAYYDIYGSLIISHCKILLAYLKSWMLIDIIAFLPFDSINLFQSSKDTKINPLFKLARLPRLYKLFKISKVLKCLKLSNRYGIMMKMQDILTIRHSVMRLITTLFTIIICVHIAACMWYFVARLEDFNQDTWVFRGGYLDSDILTLYISGLYWAFTTFATIGYGDIYAVTNSEMVFAMIWMIFSTHSYGFTISTLLGFLQSIDTRDKALLNKLAIIDEFSNEAGLPKAMRLKLRSALRHSSSISGFSFTEKYNILAELPKALRYEVASAMHHGATKELDFFYDKDTVIISAIIPYLVPIYVNSNQFVYSYMDYPNELYFIVKGRVDYLHPIDSLVVYTIKKKDYFGDIELLLKIPRKYEAVTKQHTELLTLSKELLRNIKKDYETIWLEMKGVAIERERLLHQNYLDILVLENNKKLGIRSRNRFQTKMKLKRDWEMLRRNGKSLKEIEICPIDIEEKIEEFQELIVNLNMNIRKASCARVPYLDNAGHNLVL